MDGPSVTFVLQTVEFLSSSYVGASQCHDACVEVAKSKELGAGRKAYFAPSPQSSPLAGLGTPAHALDAPQPPFPETAMSWALPARRKQLEVARGPRCQLPPGAIPIPERKACISRKKAIEPAGPEQTSSTLLGRLSLY
mmetsp:Transcript_30814/g.71140  ORF Transcript_30814/g.71140 Transcript_30814/m.71140 type:complete len:139 (+) Transcript_30814:54-470(+)